MIEGMIDITGADLALVAQVAYDLSVPQGLGFLHYSEGGLDRAEAEGVVQKTDRGRIALSMDYVRGRACKLTVFREGDRLFIRDRWYDHSESDLEALLKRIGVTQRA